jgi:hypothetical protein
MAPCFTNIFCFPETAGCKSSIHNKVVAGDTRNFCTATAAIIRTHQAPFEAFIRRLLEQLLLFGKGFQFLCPGGWMVFVQKELREKQAGKEIFS